MEFSSFFNYTELQLLLGAKIKETRLSIGRYNQKEQAAAAGVAYSTYRLIEQQGKGSIEDFMKILISMGKVDALNLLFEKKEARSVMDNFADEYSNSTMRHSRPKRCIQRIRS